MLELVALKTKSSRRPLELDKALVTTLQRHRAHQLRMAAKYGQGWNPLDLVFPTSTGQPMQHSALTHTYFRPTCVLAGIAFRTRTNKEGFRIHDCRHSACTYMLRRGDNIVIVQFRMGHSSLELTRRYLQLLTPEERRRVA